jgi:hypothetical protein
MVTQRIMVTQCIMVMVAIQCIMIIMSINEMAIN